MTNDQPSTSGYNPDVCQHPEDDEEEVKDELEEAWETFVDKVSVAGWKEAFDEKIPWIRLIFQLTLLGFLSLAIFYTYGVVTDWIDHKYKDDVQVIFNLPNLAAPNVTICAQVSINKTFIQEKVTVPPKIITDLTRLGYTVEQFLSQFTLYLMKTTRVRQIDQILVSYFEKLVVANPQMEDYSEFMVAMQPTCESMLTNCKFNGEPFDCCERASGAIVADDGVCYTLAVRCMLNISVIFSVYPSITTYILV